MKTTKMQLLSRQYIRDVIEANELETLKPTSNYM